MIAIVLLGLIGSHMVLDGPGVLGLRVSGQGLTISIGLHFATGVCSISVRGSNEARNKKIVGPVMTCLALLCMQGTEVMHETDHL